MTAPAWMPLYVADYLADTGHLSTVEHGAYMLLIMHYWQHGELPTDEHRLARICRLSIAEWSALRDTLADLFDDDWRHGRIDREIADACETMNKRSAAGKRAASVRYANRMRSAVQTHAPKGVGEGTNLSDTPTEEEEASPRARTPRDQLAEVLDDEHAAAVVEARARMRKPLTVRAAGLLARQLGQWPDPNAAADEMIVRGWSGFKPEWMANSTGPPAWGPKPKSYAVLALELENEIGNDRENRLANGHDAGPSAAPFGDGDPPGDERGDAGPGRPPRGVPRAGPGRTPYGGAPVVDLEPKP